MKIIYPYAKILNVPDTASGVSILQTIENAARVSHRSEDLQTEDTWDKFIRAVVINHGDWSVVEHSSVSVEFLVDRGITHEIVRHRLFSYTQESTRFVNYDKKENLLGFIYPKPEGFCHLCMAGMEPTPDPHGKGWKHSEAAGTLCTYNEWWLWSIQCSENAYKNLLANSWKPQEARSVLPNALASKLIMTGNLRNWRHFLLMRTSKETHPQMKQVTIPLLKEFQEKIPILFEDIIPEARQADNIAKGR